MTDDFQLGFAVGMVFELMFMAIIFKFGGKDRDDKNRVGHKD